MDREKIITIVLGLVVGIILAATYFFGSKFLPNFNKQAKPTAAITKRIPPREKTDDKIITLTITDPDDNSSTSDKTIRLSGTYTPNSTIVLFAPDDEKIATSDAQGKFNFDVVLEGGENEITVSSFNKDGKLISAKRNVTMEVTQ